MEQGWAEKRERDVETVREALASHASDEALEAFERMLEIDRRRIDLARKHREDEITELIERLEEARGEDFDRGEEP